MSQEKRPKKKSPRNESYPEQLLDRESGERSNNGDEMQEQAKANGGSQPKEQAVNVRREALPPSSSGIDPLTKWYEEHESNPYPSQLEMSELASAAELTETQARQRFARERRLPLSQSVVERLRTCYDQHYQRSSKSSSYYPWGRDMDELAATTGLNEEHIRGWFRMEGVRRKRLRELYSSSSCATGEVDDDDVQNNDMSLSDIGKNDVSGNNDEPNSTRPAIAAPNDGDGTDRMSLPFSKLPSDIAKSGGISHNITEVMAREQIRKQEEKTRENAKRKDEVTAGEEVRLACVSVFRLCLSLVLCLT